MSAKKTQKSSESAQQSKECNVKVFLRTRPLSERERINNMREIVTVNPDRREISIDPHTRRVERKFTFDGVFSPESTQAQLYKEAVVPVVEEVLKGFNCTVFAYGQTGTGKTYTMEGGVPGAGAGSLEHWQPNSLYAGVIPRAIHQIFSELESQDDESERAEHVVRVSHLELYKEELIDLLSDEERTHKLFDDGRQGVRITNLEEVLVTNADDICKVLEKSSQARHSAATKINANSSRSHCIFTITIQMKMSTVAGEDVIKIGKLNLVDLAGSENIGRSGATDDRQREAGEINKSLLTLGRVITALTDHRAHVPYRESKLTRLLQESLGGRAKTAIIATISPAAESYEETLSTLEYAHRAKRIKNTPQINQTMTKRKLINDYETEIERLKSALTAARTKNGVYLPNEQYEQMLRDIRGTSEQAADLGKELDKRQAQMDELAELNEQLQRELSGTKQRLRDTETRLADTQRQLEETRVELQRTTVQLHATEAVVLEHEETERRLQERQDALVLELDRCAHELAGLHDKVERAANVERLNKEAGAEFRERLHETVSDGERRMENLVSEHMASIERLRDEMSAFAEQRRQDTLAVQKMLDAQHQCVLGSAQRVKELVDRRQAAGDAGVRGNERTLMAMRSSLHESMNVYTKAVAAAADAMKASVAEQHAHTAEWRAHFEQAVATARQRVRSFVTAHGTTLETMRVQFNEALQHGAVRFNEHARALHTDTEAAAQRAETRRDEVLRQIASLVTDLVGAHNADVRKCVDSVAKGMDGDAEQMRDADAELCDVAERAATEMSAFESDETEALDASVSDFATRVAGVQTFVDGVHTFSSARNDEAVSCAAKCNADAESAVTAQALENESTLKELSRLLTQQHFETESLAKEADEARADTKRTLDAQLDTAKEHVDAWSALCEKHVANAHECAQVHVEEAQGTELAVHQFVEAVRETTPTGATPARRNVHVERDPIRTRPADEIISKFIEQNSDALSTQEFNDREHTESAESTPASSADNNSGAADTCLDSDSVPSRSTTPSSEVLADTGSNNGDESAQLSSASRTESHSSLLSTSTSSLPSSSVGGGSARSNRSSAATLRNSFATASASRASTSTAVRTMRAVGSANSSSRGKSSGGAPTSTEKENSEQRVQSSSLVVKRRANSSIGASRATSTRRTTNRSGRGRGQ